MDAEIAALLAQPKQVLQWRGLARRNNHAGHLMGVGDLADINGITIPGLTMQIELKAPIDAARCLFLFSLMLLQARERRRIYQLEVCPQNKRSHNGKEGPVYGPHEHIGQGVFPVADPKVSCDNWAGALQWFFAKTHITPFDIQDPNHVHL